MMAKNHHRLPSANWTSSPNSAPRPANCLPELIVVHCVSLPEGQYATGAPERLFLDQLDLTEHPSFHDLEGVHVAPHLFIDRLGNIQQFVGFDHQAWHAGVSSWQHRSGCNNYSIGIELEGTVNSPFTQAQYRVLTATCRWLLARYPSIGFDAIVGHMEIAPTRKNDPGRGFDWNVLFQGLYSSIVNSP
jgi:AmpD protein